MRTFLALWPPAAWCAAAQRLQDAMRRGARDPRIAWTAPDLFHVTVLFLGEVSPAALDAWAPSLRALVAASAAPVLRPAVPGAFPHPNRPRVVWLGIADASDHTLQDLHGAVAGHARQTGVLGRARPETFHPHLTLARLRPDAAHRGPAWCLSTGSEGGWGPEESAWLTLDAWRPSSLAEVESRTVDGRVRYHVRREFPFAGA